MTALTSETILDTVDGFSLRGTTLPGMEHVLTPEAQTFLVALARNFEPRRQELLRARCVEQERLDKGGTLDFLPETHHIRTSQWTVAPLPADLEDRRVEITGPTDRKMVINALNSGARVFMADFEDALSPTWTAVIEGQINMHDAVRRTISYTSPDGKQYALKEHPAVLIVRPRGWHLMEKHVWVDSTPIAGAFFDFGLYLFHNARALLARGTGPYFYLPKTEHYREAELWRDVFIFAEKTLGLTQGTIKATVLIETITAAFQMEEILFALKDYCVALNCGRWDYIFSFIKKFNRRPDFILPDRASVTMASHFLLSYSLLLIHTTHKRGALAMGGMSAFIPVKSDPVANEKAMEAVKLDKEREADNGHDGTWVAHPGLIPVAQAVFDRVLPGKNQRARLRDDVTITAQDLLVLPKGEITETGLRNNISVALQYIASWLGGNGCVPIFNLMEDAATAEISRSQLWQWITHHAQLNDGRMITKELFRALRDEEKARILTLDGVNITPALLDKAVSLLTALVEARDFTEFLTLPGYTQLG